MTNTPSAYPVVDRAQVNWLIALVEGIAPSPDDVVGVARIRGADDIEFRIELTEAARSSFPEQVCADLHARVATQLNHPAPVLRFYVNGEPLSHTAASEEEELDYLAHGGL